MLPNVSRPPVATSPSLKTVWIYTAPAQTQFPSPDTHRASHKPSSGAEREQQVLARLRVDSQEEEVQIIASVTPQARAASHVRDEADVSGEGRPRAPPPGCAVLGRTCKEEHHPFLIAKSTLACVGICVRV